MKPAAHAHTNSMWTVFRVFLRLGLTSFGGPIAHLGYFREEFVARRRWLTDREYADLVALCQFLPGPASSQVGIAVGLFRRGLPGALAAWAGFTLPSALALMLLARGISANGNLLPAGVSHGLQVAAVAVVAQAVLGMRRTLIRDRAHALIAVGGAIGALVAPSAWGQVLTIAVAAAIGLVVPVRDKSTAVAPMSLPVGRRGGTFALALLVTLLIALPLAALAFPESAVPVVDTFYRAGALVFGGGHVVLPMLQAEVVPNGWVDADTFLAGYGAAQAVPGPLFTFAAFLGTSLSVGPSGWLGGLLCLVAVFAPSFLLVIGTLPVWNRLRNHGPARSAMGAVNAAVVGLLAAALYRPLGTHALHDAVDVALAAAGCLALMRWKVPLWAVVAGCAVFGAATAG